MRFLLLLVLAGAGYLGYNYYVDHKEDVDQRISALIHGGATEGQPAASPAPETAPAQPAVTAPAPPAFTSRIDASGANSTGEKQLAAPGTFYVVKRVKVMTNNGVKALSPGEKVKLLQRIGGGKMKVTSGDSDFEVAEAEVTNDLDLAREAEKQEFVARGGKL